MDDREEKTLGFEDRLELVSELTGRIESGALPLEDAVKEYERGMKMLADAMEADLPYVIGCPAILICGEKDQAGSAKSYNRRWAKKEALPLYWIKNAGHNSNTDRPEEVNRTQERDRNGDSRCGLMMHTGK